MKHSDELKFLTLDVIVPTFNRADLVARTLASLAAAEKPRTLEITITVVDNNSTDDTQRTIADSAALFNGIKFESLFEPRQGKTFALNAALVRARADLISIVDDDEEIQPDWYSRVAELFGARWDEIDFAGGKVLPRFASDPPAWVAPGYAGIGWRDYGDREWFFGAETPMLSGGHAIFKREIFDQLGLFDENIGPSGKNLMGCEDDVLYDKLLNAGKTGVYDPRLVIYHHVPEYRLTKNYFRQWFYGNGASQHLMDVHYKTFEGARVFGVPRFMYRTAANSLLAAARAKLNPATRETAFTKEPAFWVFCGYFNERNFKNRRFARPLHRLAARFMPSVVR